jgi:hypothetical protein
VPIGYSVRPLAPLCPQDFVLVVFILDFVEEQVLDWHQVLSNVCFRWHILRPRILAQACFVRRWKSPLPKPGWFELPLVIWRCSMRSLFFLTFRSILANACPSCACSTRLWACIIFQYVEEFVSFDGWFVSGSLVVALI